MVFQMAPPRYGWGRGRGLAASLGRGGLSVRDENTSIVKSHPLGELLAFLKMTDLKFTGQNDLIDASIRDCSYVTSYNWLHTKSPTIVIPGQHLYAYMYLRTRLSNFEKENRLDGHHLSDRNG